MNTAVQLRRTTDADPHSELIHGAPLGFREGRLGPIALFPSATLVAYLLRVRRRQSLYVFRTLHTDDRLAARLPGVWPSVRLLVNVHSKGRAHLVRSLFRYLARSGSDPSLLSDGFWFRLGTVLGGRLPRQKILRSLLSRESNSL